MQQILHHISECVTECQHDRLHMTEFKSYWQLNQLRIAENATEYQHRQLHIGEKTSRMEAEPASYTASDASNGRVNRGHSRVCNRMAALSALQDKDPNGSRRGFI